MIHDSSERWLSDKRTLQDSPSKFVFANMNTGKVSKCWSRSTVRTRKKRCSFTVEKFPAKIILTAMFVTLHPKPGILHGFFPLLCPRAYESMSSRHMQPRRWHITNGHSSPIPKRVVSNFTNVRNVHVECVSTYMLRSKTSFEGLTRCIRKRERSVGILFRRIVKSE